MSIHERVGSKVSGGGMATVLFLLFMVGIIELGSLNEALSDEEPRWLFKKGRAFTEEGEKAFDEFASVEYDDSQWQQIPAPVAWEAVKEWKELGLCHEYNHAYKKYCLDCGKERKGIHKGYPGWGWYRLHITIPEDWAGEELTLFLGKIKMEAEVYFNGKKLEGPDYWKTLRKYTIRPELVNFGGNNLIAIRCRTRPKYPAQGGIYEGPLKIVSIKGMMYLPSILLKEVFHPEGKPLRLPVISKFKLPESGLEWKMEEIGKDEYAESPSYQFYVMNERVIGCGKFRRGETRFNFRIAPFDSTIRRLQFAFHNQKGGLKWGKDIIKEEEFITRPESSILTYRGPGYIVKEIIFAPRQIPGVIILLDVDTEEELEIRAGFMPIYELHYPLQKISFKELCGWDKNINGWVFKTKGDERYWTIVGANKENISPMLAVKKEVGFEEEFPIIVKVKPEEAEKEYIAFFIAGSIEGEGDAYSCYSQVLQGVKDSYLETVEYYRGIDTSGLSIETPNKWVDYAWRWYKTRCDQTYITTPGLGTDMWESVYEDGGFHYFVGPEYHQTLGAFLGRDKLRATLDFWYQFQGVDGEARGSRPCEISPSPTIHNRQKPAPLKEPSFYHPGPGPFEDLYWYVRWTGDIEYLRKRWQTVLNGIYFLTHTLDKNGDLIPDVAPGGGEFPFIADDIFAPFKGKTIICSTLSSGCGVLLLFKKMVELAEILDEDESAREWRGYIRQIKETLNKINYWDEEKNWLVWIMTTEGDHVLTVRTTSLIESPLYSKFLPSDKADYMLQAINSDEFTTNFGGVWYMSLKDPMRGRAGYTWAGAPPWIVTDDIALLNYIYHFPEAGFRNLMANVNLVKNTADAPEAVNPTSNGKYRYNNCLFQGGVYILTPILSGLLGIEPDAPKGEFSFKPHLPEDWPFVRIKNLSMGDSVFDLELVKEKGVVKITVERRKGEKIKKILLSPAFPKDTEIREVRINRRKLSAGDFKLVKTLNDIHCEVSSHIGNKLEVSYQYE